MVCGWSGVGARDCGCVTCCPCIIALPTPVGVESKEGGGGCRISISSSARARTSRISAEDNPLSRRNASFSRVEGLGGGGGGGNGGGGGGEMISIPEEKDDSVARCPSSPPRVYRPSIPDVVAIQDVVVDQDGHKTLTI